MAQRRRVFLMSRARAGGRQTVGLGVSRLGESEDGGDQTVNGESVVCCFERELTHRVAATLCLVALAPKGTPRYQRLRKQNAKDPCHLSHRKEAVEDDGLHNRSGPLCFTGGGRRTGPFRGRDVSRESRTYTPPRWQHAGGTLLYIYVITQINDHRQRVNLLI